MWLQIFKDEFINSDTIAALAKTETDPALYPAEDGNAIYGIRIVFDDGSVRFKSYPTKEIRDLAWLQIEHQLQVYNV